MCDKFFESVGVPEETLFSSPLNVIHQLGENVEGAFVNHFMVTQFFRKYSPEADSARALIISTHHSKGHWISVGSKLGTNLAVLEEKGALTVIDLMREVYDNLKLEEPKSTDNCSFCLRSLFTRCEDIIQDYKKTSGSKRILVIVEDLTNFLHCNDSLSTGKFRNSERLLLEFILKLKALSVLSREEDQCSVTIASLIQSPEVPSESLDYTRFAKSLSQTLASVVFEVAPLNTGFSSQVTGYLKVIFNPDVVPHSIKKVETPFVRNFHFKLESNGARVIPL